MRLELNSLNCQSLVLDNDKQPASIFRLEELSEGTGAMVFREGLTLLESIAIRQVLGGLDLVVGEGTLKTLSSAAISHVRCEGRIRNGLVGELRASHLSSDCIELALPSIRAKSHLIAEGLLVKLDGRGGRVEVNSLTLQGAEFDLSKVRASVDSVRVGSISFSGLKVSWDEGRPRVSCTKAYARDLRLRGSDLEIEIAAIDLQEGFSLKDTLQVEKISIGEIAIRKKLVPEALAIGTDEEQVGEGEVDETFEAPPAIPPISSIRLDREVFDTVSGQVNADITLGLILPVIGKRVGTHHFRIPVEGGLIDFRDVENGLSDLEDAFVNIRLRGDALVLERDIPLIPGLDKPIVRWPLEAAEIELAKQHLVRIATLPDLQLVNKDKSNKKSESPLLRLDVDNIAIRLSLDETAVLASVEGSLRAHVDEIEVSGSVHHRPQSSQAQETELSAQGRGLGVVAKDLDIAGHKLSASLQVAALEEFRCKMVDARPQDLVLRWKNVVIEQLSYEL